VVDYDSVAFNDAVDSEITAISSICDFPIFQDFNGHLHRLNG